jgi:protein-disulfide isomerase
MRLSALGASILLVVLLVGCSPTSAQQTKELAPTDVVATVGSTSFTLAQVDDKALQQPTGSFGSMKLSEALYEARRQALVEMIDDALIDQDAEARGVDRATLVRQEITAKVAPVTEADIAAWYEQNRARLQGAPLDQARPAIRSYLQQQRTLDVRQQYVDRLRSKTTVRIGLVPPRQTVAADGRPSQGPASAPVEMIEFSDFQCPYCELAFPTVKKVLSTYGDKIYFVYRNFPLDMHPQARPAAEAAQCAAEQGKFWAYHDVLFGNQSRLQEADLKQHAVELGLNATQFDACVDSHKYKDEVDADLRAGEEAGVTGTPTFFINGRLLSGAQPFEAFKEIIDEELAAKH